MSDHIIEADIMFNGLADTTRFVLSCTIRACDSNNGKACRFISIYVDLFHDTNQIPFFSDKEAARGPAVTTCAVAAWI